MGRQQHSYYCDCPDHEGRPAPSHEMVWRKLVSIYSNSNPPLACAMNEIAADLMVTVECVEDALDYDRDIPVGRMSAQAFRDEIYDRTPGNLSRHWPETQEGRES